MLPILTDLLEPLIAVQGQELESSRGRVLMAKITGIEKASYKELVEARDAIDAALVKRKEEERSEVKRKLAELANESGFEITELFGGRRGGKKTSGSAKYRNPKDSSQTWTGRGRKPNWLVEALGQGAKIESFELR
jgi:DNA-binding protein H-NS